LITYYLPGNSTSPSCPIQRTCWYCGSYCRNGQYLKYWDTDRLFSDLALRWEN